MPNPGRHSRVNLHEALVKPSFDHAVICTYTFDPLFFENYCLEKFSSLSHANISILTDRSTYLKAIRCSGTNRPRLVNLRYLLHPIDVNRRFHPKLFLFTAQKTGRLIVGSANFTRSGLTTNAEVVDVFDFALDKEETTLPLFQEAIGFLAALAGRWQCQSLASNLAALQRNTPWLHTKVDRSSSTPRLIHNLQRSLCADSGEGNSHSDRMSIKIGAQRR